MSNINRITLFKIPNVEDQQTVLGMYKDMGKKALKDGKPYILSVTAGATFPDQRAQGYTVAAISVFASAEDMAYYDNDCAAHAKLRAFARTVHQGYMMAYFENTMS